MKRAGKHRAAGRATRCRLRLSLEATLTGRLHLLINLSDDLNIPNSLLD